MHEYILHSQLPAVRGRQVLNILAGVTASQPVPIREENVVLAERQVQEPIAAKKTKQQQVKQVPSYRRLVRNVTRKSDGSLYASPWQLRAEQTPDPGMPNLISRQVNQREFEPQEIEKLNETYDLKTAYTVFGHRFVHGNVIVRIVRMHIPVNNTTVDLSAPTEQELRVLDPSGNWLVEAITRVEDPSNSELTDKAKKDLLAFQNLMEGAIDFYTPDRFALDTRIRNV